MRKSGILMHISSLPSEYGIGKMGKSAYDFVDFLVKAGVKCWQILPLSPTSYGDSPYQSFSSFAGNPYYIDLEYLIEEGLLKEEEICSADFGARADDIDYAAVFLNRFQVLRMAFARSSHQKSKEFKAFLKDNSYWIDDYSFYMAVKFHFENRSWQEWDEDIRLRRREAVEKYRKLLAEDIEFWKFCQFKFREQWNRLRAYVNQLGMKFIGDIPLYVAMDSSDVWVHRELFELDEDCEPIHMSGI